MTNHARSSRFPRMAAPVLLIALASALPAAAQDNDPDRAVSGGGKFPANWKARADRGTADQINFTQAGDVFHFVMGPAGTFFNAGWTKSGNYSYSARLTQTKAPSHPTSYGLMIGGSDLAGPKQTYTYFLVRNQGDFYIANKEGNAPPVTVVNWTPNAAIAKQGPDGKQTNTLGIQVQGDNVIFTVNGTEVTRLAKSRVHTDGLNGFRIGHNLDVDVDQVKR
jgi:hypothetical protein